MTERKLDRAAKSADLNLDGVRTSMLRETLKAAQKAGGIQAQLVEDCIEIFQNGRWPDGTKVYRDSSRLVALRALINSDSLSGKMLTKLLGVASEEAESGRKLSVNIVVTPVGVVEGEIVDD